jgi:hypothetical protein
MSARLLTATALALATLAGCGDDEDARAPEPRPVTAVTIGADIDGEGPKPERELSLRCPSAQHELVCARLRRLPYSAFEPVPPDTACTSIYGGPATGWIRGTVRGRRVDARYSRRNGCEIARFEKVQPLLQAAAR